MLCTEKLNLNYNRINTLCYCVARLETLKQCLNGMFISYVILSGVTSEYRDDFKTLNLQSIA